MRCNGPIRCEKALGLPGGLEPLHPSFPLSRGLVRVFGTVFPINVEDIPLLVHSSPEIMLFATNGQKNLIQMPLVPRSGPPMP